MQESYHLSVGIVVSDRIPMCTTKQIGYNHSHGMVEKKNQNGHKNNQKNMIISTCAEIDQNPFPFLECNDASCRGV